MEAMESVQYFGVATPPPPSPSMYGRSGDDNAPKQTNTFPSPSDEALVVDVLKLAVSFSSVLLPYCGC